MLCEQRGQHPQAQRAENSAVADQERTGIAGDQRHRRSHHDRREREQCQHVDTALSYRVVGKERHGEQRATRSSRRVGMRVPRSAGPRDGGAKRLAPAVACARSRSRLPPYRMVEGVGPDGDLRGRGVRIAMFSGHIDRDVHGGRSDKVLVPCLSGLSCCLHSQEKALRTEASKCPRVR